MLRYTIAIPQSKSHELVAALRGKDLVEDVIHSQADLDQVQGRRIVLLSWLHILQESFLQQQHEVLNVHNSLLPRYRGRHAFTWAIIRGESEVGYTMHAVVPQIDSGPIYSQVRIPIMHSDDINTLFRRAHVVLRDWLPTQLSLHSRGLLVATLQDESIASYYPARKPGDSEIEWNQPFESIRNFVRAQRPPYTLGAFVEHNGQRFGVDQCVAGKPRQSKFDVGQVVSISPTGSAATIACRDFEVEVSFVQDPSMDINRWLQAGDRLRF